MFETLWTAIRRLFGFAPPEIAAWHVTEYNGPSSFNIEGTYADAVREMRARAPGSVILRVDAEWHVIFYSVPK